MNTETIPNWTTFGSDGTSINVYEYEGGTYQAALGVFLDDNQVRDTPETHLHIDVLLDIWGDDVEEVAKKAYEYAKLMFDDVFHEAFFFDKDGEMSSILLEDVEELEELV
jgi:hypothetical protein